MDLVGDGSGGLLQAHLPGEGLAKPFSARAGAAAMLIRARNPAAMA